MSGFTEAGESQSSGNVTNEQQVLEGSSMEAICSAARHLCSRAASGSKRTHTKLIDTGA